MTQGALAVEQGALYPALYRLERQGMLAAEWGTSDNNRRAKYYKLTASVIHVRRATGDVRCARAMCPCEVLRATCGATDAQHVGRGTARRTPHIALSTLRYVGGPGCPGLRQAWPRALNARERGWRAGLYG